MQLCEIFPKQESQIGDLFDFLNFTFMHGHMQKVIFLFNSY